MRHLTHRPNRIPGLQRTDGTQPTRRQITRSIETIFDQRIGKSDFVHQDPLSRFFMEIGRENAELITRIVIQGRWNWIVGKWKDTESQAVGLHDLLPIYTHILGEVCKNIHTIVLHDDDDGRPQLNNLGPPGTDREQEINDTIRKLVQGLPKLQRLQLGRYKFVPVGCGYDSGVPGSEMVPFVHPNDEWGNVLKWMGFVEERAKSRVVANTQYEGITAQEKRKKL